MAKKEAGSAKGGEPGGYGKVGYGKIDETCINTIRFLAVDAVEKANSGHPGMPMGDAAMAYVLWTRFLRHNPGNPLWHGRDRFVLSAGHGSMLLYSLLHLTGYPFTLDDLKDFRQWGSKTPGHPERNQAIGIETTTGPLGQGFATGVGMEMARRYLAGKYDRPGFKLFDYHIYAITSDGDLMEGISNEAASIAGHLGLGGLVYLYSSNHITIEGETEITFTEDVEGRFKALNWHTRVLEDGNDLDKVEAALKAAKAETKKPSIIITRTHIGFGCSKSKEDNADSHGAPLGAEEVKYAKERLGWPLEPTFHIPEDALTNFRGAKDIGSGLEADWNKLFDAYSKEHPELATELRGLLDGNLGQDLLKDLPSFKPEDGPMATRSASGKVINAIAPKAPFLIGGSADLGPSNNTVIKGAEYFDNKGNTGPNIHFGVREHAMGAILNGMALSGGLVPYGGTFLVFSDYMRGAIRIASLSKLHLVYVFTHDSIGLGEDGPTHQPVEHLASLRAMPNLTVIRPADATETTEAWRVALERKNGPVALILSRQKLSVIDRAKYASTAEDLKRGAYVLADLDDGSADNGPEIIIIATGSEVEVALGARELLKDKGIGARVVSMPSFELFEEQDEEYKNEVLPPKITTRVSVEAASTLGWHKYVGSAGAVIGIESFGESAPYKRLFKEFGFTAENVAERVLALLKEKAGTKVRA